MKLRIYILFIALAISPGVMFGQRLLNDTTGRIVNSGILRFVCDTAKFGNFQPDINKIDNKGAIEFLGSQAFFTDGEFKPSFLGDAGSTALGSTAAFRVPGLVRYNRAISTDTQFVQARFFSDLEFDKAAPKRIPSDVYVSDSFRVTSSSGDRHYDGTFHYDGASSQTIFPENSDIFRTNRYYNVELLVSDGNGKSDKTLGQKQTARLDGVLTSSSQAPLFLRGALLLGSDGADTSITNGTIDIDNGGMLEMGRRPIRYNANITAKQGKIYAPDTAGAMHVTASATMLLASDAGQLDIRENRLMIATGDYRNSGSGANASFDKTSTVVFDGVAGQKIEHTLLQNPYGNVRTKLAKSGNGNVFVASSLTVDGGDVSMNKDTLTMLDAAEQPKYIGGLEEIIGAMRRMNISASSSKYTFNNASTNVVFTSDTSTYPSEMTLTVAPLAAPANPPIRYDYLTDINRRIIIDYSDTSKQWQATVRAGYRSAEIDRAAESQLVFFENWADSAKEINAESVNPGYIYSRQAASPSTFGYIELQGVHSAASTGISGAAKFASGHDLVLRSLGGLPLVIFAKAYLEGAYRGGELMGTELVDRNLTPLTPPAIYPYLLDSARAFETVVKIPDSVVDWVTLEFRSQLTGGVRYYRNCFIQSNGTLVDFDGKSPIILPMTQKGDYYVGLRHRNHLAVMTESPVALGYSSTASLLDFSNASLVAGNFSALKPVELIGARYVYGLVAGDVDGNGVVDELDYTSVWTGRDYENYLNTDTQMNGIVNTVDFNISWNNRLRQTFVTP